MDETTKAIFPVVGDIILFPVSNLPLMNQEHWNRLNEAGLLADTLYCVRALTVLPPPLHLPGFWLSLPDSQTFLGPIWRAGWDVVISNGPELPLLQAHLDRLTTLTHTSPDQDETTCARIGCLHQLHDGPCAVQEQGVQCSCQGFLRKITPELPDETAFQAATFLAQRMGLPCGGVYIKEALKRAQVPEDGPVHDWHVGVRRALGMLIPPCAS